MACSLLARAVSRLHPSQQGLFQFCSHDSDPVGSQTSHQYMEGNKAEDRGRCSRPGGRMFNRQGDLLRTRLVLGYKMSRCPPQAPGFLKIYREAFIGFSHMHHPYGLNHTCSLKAASLKTLPPVGTVGRVYIPRTGEGRGASNCPGSVLGSTCGHILSMTSFNKTHPGKSIL